MMITLIALKEPLKHKLDRLTDKDILKPVHAPTDWVSSLVVATKRIGKIRLCIDPKPLNKALKRSYYLLPVNNDLLPKLTNARVFTVVDTKNDFWHVHLDESSYHVWDPLGQVQMDSHAFWNFSCSRGIPKKTRQRFRRSERRQAHF